MFAMARKDGPNYTCVDNPTYDQIQDNDGDPNGCGEDAAFAFYISYLLIVAFVFLNLFIAVILQ
jgi:hypothetical protein